MVRVGSLHDQFIVDPDFKENKTGMLVGEQIQAILKRVAELTPRKDRAYMDIMKSLSEYGFQQVDFRSLSAEEEQFLQAYFNSEILPLISPQVIDKRHPFPFLKNKEIYAAVSIESKSDGKGISTNPKKAAKEQEKAAKEKAKRNRRQAVSFCPPHHPTTAPSINLP